VSDPAAHAPPPAPRVTVTMCACRGVPFARLLPLARAGGWDLDELMRRTGCGTQCGLCRPYLRAMLADGRTVFHELLAEPAR
jgi:bacterioferritin-associated ferredoxin